MSKELRVVLVLLAIMMVVQFTVVGCGDILSPTMSNLQDSENDQTDSDPHDGITESCGSANENSACHSD